MKKSKFTESQIIKILGEQEKGRPVAEICRDYGISQHIVQTEKVIVSR